MEKNVRDQKFDEAIAYLKDKGFTTESDHYEFKEYDLDLDGATLEIHMHMLKNGRGFKDCCPRVRFPWIYPRTQHGKIHEFIDIGKPTKEPSPEYIDDVIAVAKGLRDSVVIPAINAAAFVETTIKASKTIK